VVFGKVIDGMNVVKMLENTMTGKDDKPFARVEISNSGELVRVQSQSEGRKRSASSSSSSSRYLFSYLFIYMYFIIYYHEYS
jgi:cyclophilin family peptidyl-prolyl cis-trans isomerase